MKKTSSTCNYPHSKLDGYIKDKITSDWIKKSVSTLQCIMEVEYLHTCSLLYTRILNKNEYLIYIYSNTHLSCHNIIQNPQKVKKVLHF